MAKFVTIAQGRQNSDKSGDGSLTELAGAFKRTDYSPPPCTLLQIQGQSKREVLVEEATVMKSSVCVAVCLLLTAAIESRADDPTEQPSPTRSDVSYGPDTRNVLDFWAASGDGPRPLLIYIHGGGWLTGDKSKKVPAIQPFLDKGVSFTAINYRLTPQHPLPAPVHDAARAIQFLRSQAKGLNIDTEHIALTGPSAGACTAMWLLLHDDLADSKSLDPVLRESTRVCAASVSVGQTSIDPRVIEGWLGPNVLKHPMIANAVGELESDNVLSKYDQYRDLFVEFSPINHLDSRDPPLFMTCSAEMDLPSRDAGQGIHHPVYGVKLKEKSDQLGHECHLLIPGYSQSNKYTDSNEFLFQMLLSK